MKQMRMMAFALFFVIALAFAALAAGLFLTHDFKGQVTFIDPSSGRLTVRAADPFAGAPTFTVDDITRVTMCGQPKTLQEVKVGDRVTVTYHEDSGKLYAEAIELPAPLVACLLPVR